MFNVYIAEKEARTGLREANITAFPNLGYVPEKPDLVISRIENVSFAQARIPGPDSGSKTIEDRTQLVLKLKPKDAEALNQLTSKHISDRLLVLLNDEPLVAPEIRTPSIGQDVYITPPHGTDTSQIKAKLETLVRKSQ